MFSVASESQTHFLASLGQSGLNAAPSASVEPARSYLPAEAREKPDLNQRRVGNGMLQRTIDICLALALLVFFAPLMLFVGLAIACVDPGPLFFSQERLGRQGRTFLCLKFRTMRTDAAAVLESLLERDDSARSEWVNTQKLRNDPRVSPVGRFLRKTSLDELPQLLNVLKGEMSIVGPRPIVASEARRYGKHIASYYTVKPGITGLWQINGRNHTTYRRRVACDVCYARGKSLHGDLAIIALTVPTVLLGRGAY